MLLMADIRHMARWVRALLIALLAVAVLAPSASVQAQPCVDHAGFMRGAGVVHAHPVMPHAEKGLQSGHAPIDRAACCSTVSSICIVKGIENLPAPARTVIGQHYELRDQVARSLALAPALDPPRFRV